MMISGACPKHRPHPGLHWCREQACASCSSEDAEEKTDFKSMAIKVCRLCFIRETEHSSAKVAEPRLSGILHSCCIGAESVRIAEHLAICKGGCRVRRAFRYTTLRRKDVESYSEMAQQSRLCTGCLGRDKSTRSELNSDLMLPCLSTRRFYGGRWPWRRRRRRLEYRHSRRGRSRY